MFVVCRSLFAETMNWYRDQAEIIVEKEIKGLKQKALKDYCTRKYELQIISKIAFRLILFHRKEFSGTSMK